MMKGQEKILLFHTLNLKRNKEKYSMSVAQWAIYVRFVEEWLEFDLHII